VKPHPREDCNRTIRVRGMGGRIPPGGAAKAPLELFVGNAGTAARFLAALLCLGEGVYRLQGVPRMQERPQAALFQALRQLGYEITTANDKLPALVRGAGGVLGPAKSCIDQSSQFASALLLCAQAGGWKVQIIGENAEESPYVEMTRQLVEKFPQGGGSFAIEPDASSGSYFIGANFLLRTGRPREIDDRRVVVEGWPASGWQIDARFPRYLPLPNRVSRARDLADSIMTAIVVSPWAAHPVCFTDLGRLRLQECERVTAMRVELGKCGSRSPRKATP